jgi:hypothetical protein
MNTLPWKSTIYSLLFLTIVIGGCKKSSHDGPGGTTNPISTTINPDTISGPNTMSEMVAEELDSLDIPNYQLDINTPGVIHNNPQKNTNSLRKLATANDQSAQTVNLLQAMFKDAAILSLKQIKLEALADQTVNDVTIHNPEQYGYGYSYGQRDLTARLAPPSGNALHRSYAIWGVDCSGFIYNLFHGQGLAIPDFTAHTFQDVLTTFLATNPTNYASAYCERLNNVAYTALIDGDFIVWDYTASDGNWIHHIGLYHKDAVQGGILFNSHGTGQPSSLAGEQKNFGLKRGIHIVSMDKAVQVKKNGQINYFGSNFYVIRLHDHANLSLTKVSGDYQQAALGSKLPQPIVVKVGDANGNGAAGMKVVFYSTDQTGFLSSTTVITDQNGNAQTYWTLGTQNALQTLSAQATDAGGSIIKNSPVIFTASNSLSKLLKGIYTGKATWTNYDGTGQDPQVDLELEIDSIDNGNHVIGYMSLDADFAVTGPVTGSISGSQISFGWSLPANAPFVYNGTFSADKTTITGTGGAGNYYSPLNANGPFTLVKKP